MQRRVYSCLAEVMCHSGAGYKMMVLLSAERVVGMVRRPGGRTSSIELLLLSKGRRGSEQLVVGKAWMNTEVEGIEGVRTY